jgi:anaerobic magnesium-protoporphyrin IX monomethyl ester cyclase
MKHRREEAVKIALVRPRYDTHLITPPLSIGYISSFLKSRGFDVEIIDGLNLNLTNEEIVRQCSDADIVGITCLSDYFPETLDLTRKLKKAGRRVAIGGPHASVLPELTLEATGADAVVVGEGEMAMLNMVEDLRDTGGIDRVYKTEFVEDLDGLPFPDWGQMDPRKYKKAPHGAFIKNFPVAPVVTTRGCPYECTFCASPKIWERSIRYRSPGNVVDEIELLVREYEVKEIHFEDDNLTLKRSHVEGICQLIIERGVKISWACPNGVRADKLDHDLLKLMEKSGCYYIAFGIESGDQKILDNVKKHIEIETVFKAVEMAEEEGIMTQGFFIFGLPGETRQTIEKTIDFSKRTKLSRAQFLLLDVLPGCELWDNLEFEGKGEWNKSSYHEVIWVPPTVDEETLKGAPPRAFKAFFLRPKQFLSIIRYVRLQQLPYLMKRVFDFRIFGGKRG